MSYTPPDGTAANFELLDYNPPTGTNADFDFSTTTPDDRASKLTGAENVSNERASKLTGTGTPDERASKLTGAIDVASERGSKLLGSGTPSERGSKLTGFGLENSDRASKLTGLGAIDRPLGYKILVKDSSGDLVGEVQSFRKVEHGKRLNNYGEANFDIRANDPMASTLIDLRKNTIEIYRRKDSADVLVWAGNQALATGKLTDKGNNWITIYCYTWFEQLIHRFTAAEKEFASTDAGAIANTLITDTNSDDDTGITIGSTTTTTDRDRTYNNQNVAEAIINLANVVSGFDFEITDAKVFNVYDIMGTDKTDSVIFEYGHNIKNMTITEDFVNPVNRAIVLGEATGETTLQRVERDDAGLQTTYGLHEGRFTEISTSNLGTLQDKGDAAIRKYGLALLKVSFDLVGNNTPSIDSFTIGDGIRLIASWGYYSIDEQYRVFEYNVSFDSKNVERLELTLGKFITI
jgi:hypothetical protein